MPPVDADDLPAAAARRAADAVVQLRQRRGAHQHQRHAAVPGQRRAARRCAGADLAQLRRRRPPSVCAELARAIAADAEGAEHLVTIEVEGLRDDAEARRVAKAVADSPLVKTAIFGADPNWGRIVSAAGYAGVAFEERDLSLWLGDMLLYRDGHAAAVRRGGGVGVSEAATAR